MSILIKGMSKPKTCDDCIVPLSKCDYLQKRADDCPIIDIVTCKECIHKIQALSTGKGATGCELISGTFYEDFFCKCGERRSE